MIDKEDVSLILRQRERGEKTKESKVYKEPDNNSYDNSSKLNHVKKCNIDSTKHSHSSLRIGKIVSTNRN